MRFLVGAQLPLALARLLKDRGHQAEHVLDCGLERVSDAAIWARAVANGASIITKDEGFAVRRVLQKAGPAVV
jgi:predicted nuclease of predicted toxin-antitoxin system